MNSRIMTKRSKPRLGILAIFCSLLFLTACTSAIAPVADNHRDHALTAFLDEATINAVQRFQQTPWGDAITLQAGERYYAASGRICRRLLLHQETDGQGQVALACKSTQGWESVRALTR